MVASNGIRVESLGREELVNDVFRAAVDGYRTRDEVGDKNGFFSTVELIEQGLRYNPVFAPSLRLFPSTAESLATRTLEAHRRRFMAFDLFRNALKAPVSGSSLARVREASARVENEAPDMTLGDVRFSDGPAAEANSIGTKIRHIPFAVLSPLYQPGEYLENDFPLELAAEILAAPQGDVGSLAKTLLKMGAWFEEKDNWVAAQYIYDQILKLPATLDPAILNQARAGMKKIMGNPEEVSPFLSSIVPPFWAYEDLPAEQRHNLLPDTLTFAALLFVGGGVTQKVASGAWNAIRVGAVNLAGRSPFLKRFTFAMADNPRAMGMIREGVEQTLKEAGKKMVALPEETLKKLAMGLPEYFLGLKSRGIPIPSSLEKLAREALAIRNIPLGNKTQLVAKILAWVGNALAWIWDHSLGLLERGVKEGFPHILSFFVLVVKMIRSIPGLGPFLAARVSELGAGLVIGGKFLRSNFQGLFIVWYLLQRKGAPYVPGPNPEQITPTVLSKLNHDGELADHIRRVGQEGKPNSLDEATAQMMKELGPLFEEVLGEELRSTTDEDPERLEKLLSKEKNHATD